MVLPGVVLGTTDDDAGREGSLACLNLFRGRAGSSIFPFPLPSTGGGRLGASAVGSFITSDLDLGEAGSGTKASSSAGGVFLFWSSFSDFLDCGFFCLATSEKRGIVSARSTDKFVKTDYTRNAIKD